MSLQVWLPLNGDLHNQGLSNFTITNNNATINNNGKIGQCYAFNGSNSYICIDYNFYNIQYSVSAWVYSTSASATQTICCDRNTVGSGFSIFLINGKLRIDPGGHNEQWTTNYTYPINTWFHLCIIYDGIKVSYYINGKFKESHNCTLNSSFWRNETCIGASQQTDSSHNNYLNGYLNDVRIYDHCLSQKEIEEISKGLVLHYKLDQPANINYNLYTGSKNFTGTWVNSDKWTTSTEDYNGFIVKQRSGTWSGLAQNITATNGDIFTISFWAKMDLGGKLQSVHRSNLGNVTTGLNILDGNFSSSNIWVNTNDDGTNWQRYWAILQITSSDITYLQWRIENSVANKNLYIAGITLEKGYGTKNWSLSASEAGTTNTIYDSSGYNNNGTVIGNLTANINNSRYSCSTIFDGTSRIMANSLPAETKTLTCWAKTTKNKSTSQQIIADSNSALTISFYQGTIIGVFGTTRSTGSKSTLGSEYKENDWNFFAVVKTSEDRKRDIYCNGIKLTPTSNDYWSAATGFFIGARNASQGNPFYGEISDVRAYATALTAEQIKELYNTSATIDNKGNIYARELVEI